jgi:hypothetical protein
MCQLSLLFPQNSNQKPRHHMKQKPQADAHTTGNKHNVHDRCISCTRHREWRDRNLMQTAANKKRGRMRKICQAFEAEFKRRCPRALHIDSCIECWQISYSAASPSKDQKMKTSTCRLPSRWSEFSSNAGDLAAWLRAAASTRGPARQESETKAIPQIVSRHTCHNKKQSCKFKVENNDARLNCVF